MSVQKLATAQDATNNFTSASVFYPKSYDWSIIVVPSGLSKSYKLTIQVSDNKTDWVDLVPESTYSKDENTIIFDDILVGEHFRVKYDANGNTSGTFDISFNAKLQD